MRKSFYIAIVLFLFSVKGLLAQVSASPHAVYFSAKSVTLDTLNFSSCLSQRALDRRARHGITFSTADVPVAKAHITAIKSIARYTGVTSKWLNLIYVEATPGELQLIQSLQCVERVVPLRGGMTKLETSEFSYGFSESQTKQISLHSLHIHSVNGYDETVALGEGMLIAVLDAGFVGANTVVINDQLNTTATKNFVEGGSNVYQGSSHGFSVLSTMATQNAQYMGTAPQASYALIKTEKELSETPEEMLNWIAGAEYADSMGADIINSSLGYSTFDDPADDYSVTDLDGRTSIISLGALAAARTGMLVVTSAGNAGGSSWDKLTFPADADSILTVGSVNQYGVASSFSSRGYTVDGRVKPNVCARGEGAVVYRPDGTLAYANGTSFSSPIMAGAAACLWSTVPDAIAQEVIEALEISASHYYQHNPRIGYGIPNLGFARRYLSSLVAGKFSEIVIYPNPFPDYISLFLPDGEALDIHLELRDLNQRTVATTTLESKRYKALWAPGDNIAAGVYILYIERGGRTQMQRVIKLL